MKAFTIALAACLMMALGLSEARADDPFYYGKWYITDAAVAPWVETNRLPDTSEMKTLMGETIELSADAVSGPGSFPCSHPQYQVLEGGADMLFQGMFGQMQAENSSVDPRKLAEEAGFTGSKFRTVITGCEYEVDFSFGDDSNTARFGLNDYIYTMQRE